MICRTTEALHVCRGRCHPFKQMRTNHTYTVGHVPQRIRIDFTAAKGIGGIGGVVELVNENEGGARCGSFQCLRGELNFAFKPGLGPWKVIWLQTHMERDKGGGSEGTDGTTVGVCQERADR